MHAQFYLESHALRPCVRCVALPSHTFWPTMFGQPSFPVQHYMTKFGQHHSRVLAHQYTATESATNEKQAGEAVGPALGMQQAGFRF